MIGSVRIDVCHVAVAVDIHEPSLCHPFVWLALFGSSFIGDSDCSGKVLMKILVHDGSRSRTVDIFRVSTVEVIRENNVYFADIICTISFSLLQEDLEEDSNEKHIFRCVTTGSGEF